MNICPAPKSKLDLTDLREEKRGRVRRPGRAVACLSNSQQLKQYRTWEWKAKMLYTHTPRHTHSQTCLDHTIPSLNNDSLSRLHTEARTHTRTHTGGWRCVCVSRQLQEISAGGIKLYDYRNDVSVIQSAPQRAKTTERNRSHALGRADTHASGRTNRHDKPTEREQEDEMSRENMTWISRGVMRGLVGSDTVNSPDCTPPLVWVRRANTAVTAKNTL